MVRAMQLVCTMHFDEKGEYFYGHIVNNFWNLFSLVVLAAVQREFNLK